MSDLSLIEPYLRGEIDPAFALRARLILEQVVKQRPQSVLDIGCGRGFYLKMISYYDFALKIHGIDLKNEHLESAAKVLPENDKRFNLQQASVYELPFENESMDFVICSEVLEHLDQPLAGISEIYRVLKKNACVAVSVPQLQFPFFWDPLNWLLMRVLKTHVSKDIHWLAGIWADHERLYQRHELEESFKNGFDILKIENIVANCLPFSHFVIYGLGKNLVEQGFFKSLNRFSFEKPSLIRKSLALIMRLPSFLLDDPQNDRIGANLFLLAKKT